MDVKNNMLKFFEEKLTTWPIDKNSPYRDYILGLVAEYTEEQKVILPLHVRKFIQEMKNSSKPIEDAIDIMKFSVHDKSKTSIKEWYMEENTNHKKMFVQAWVNGSREELNPRVRLTMQYSDGTKVNIPILQKTADTILGELEELE